MDLVKLNKLAGALKADANLFQFPILPFQKAYKITDVIDGQVSKHLVIVHGQYPRTVLFPIVFHIQYGINQLHLHRQIHFYFQKIRIIHNFAIKRRKYKEKSSHTFRLFFIILRPVI